MNSQEIDTPVDDLIPEQDCGLPRNPLFDANKDQASFIDCLNAIDRVKAIVALCDFLELDDSSGGLSSDAAFGYYWISVLIRETLSYVSDRLAMLDRKKTENHKQESTYLSALSSSLHTLDRDNRERYLNNTAAQMNMTRSAVDQFVHKRIKQQRLATPA